MGGYSPVILSSGSMYDQVTARWFRKHNWGAYRRGAQFGYCCLGTPLNHLYCDYYGRLMGMYLMSIYFTGLYLTGVCLMSMHLRDVSHVHVPYRRASYRRIPQACT